MNRSAPVVALRGSAVSLLQVQIPEMLRRPIGQVALTNTMDLIELSGTEGRPKPLDKQLQTFVGGIRRQVTDIPKGRSWEMFLEDLEELPPELVPHAFRAMLIEESQFRPDTQPRVAELVERWAAVEPLAFDVGGRAVRIQKAEMEKPRSPSPEASAAPRERAAREPGAPKTRAEKPASGPGSRAKPILDTERHDYIIQQCVERLARCSSDRGLAENVLVAGVRHAGREQYPDLTPIEITTTLKQLKETNRVRYSAGRWSIPTRY